MQFEEAARLLNIIADESRLKIISVLSHTNELCANELLSFVDIVQSTMSHHLSTMVENKILIARKSGTRTYYSINKTTYNSLIKYLQLDSSNNVEMSKKENKAANKVQNKAKEKDISSKKDDMPSFLL